MQDEDEGEGEGEDEGVEANAISQEGSVAEGRVAVMQGGTPGGEPTETRYARPEGTDDSVQEPLVPGTPGVART